MVEDLGLVVDLWVINGGKFKGGSLELEEFVPKSTNEDAVSIQDDGLGQPMKAKNFKVKPSCKS